MSDPIWISEAEVVRLMHLGEAIDALEIGLRLEASWQAQNMNKAHLVWHGGHTLHAIGATFEGAGVFGTKTWGHTAGGATPLMIVWDMNTGALKAVIEAFAMGQMRTGGISGVATRWMADRDADDFAIIGTGSQAMTQVAAVAAVRPVKRLRVHSPRPESRQKFAERVRARFPFEVIAADSVEKAVDGASIVTTVTRAREPFLRASMLRRGAHVNAVGAISPEREELQQDIFPRAGLVVVDHLPAVQNLATEMTRFYGQGGGDWSGVKLLSSVVAGGSGRPRDCDLTLFKAMGMGISDLSLALEIHNRALAAGAGRRFAHPQRVEPRLHGN
ncbi:MAG: ornithine cyclodeaminase family protein [Betaproteobacteria bacterium]